MDLEQEAKKATEILKDKIVAKIIRHRAEEVCIEFIDGTRLFIDHKPNNVELSITHAEEIKEETN